MRDGGAEPAGYTQLLEMAEPIPPRRPAQAQAGIFKQLLACAAARLRHETSLFRQSKGQVTTTAGLSEPNRKSKVATRLKVR